MKKIIIKTVEANIQDTHQQFEDLKDFTEKTFSDVIVNMYKNSIIIDFNKIGEMKEEIKDEITEITRKKMYGHHCINDYRKTLKSKKD